MISNDNKKSSSHIAPELWLAVLSEEAIGRITANMTVMWMPDPKVRAQMQTKVAAESGVDGSYAVHTYHYLFFNLRSSAVPPPELSTEAFRAAPKAALMARVKTDAGAPDTDKEEGEGPKKPRQEKATKKKRRATDALAAQEKKRKLASDEKDGA